MSSNDKHLGFNFQNSEITAGTLPRKLPGTSIRNGTGVSGAGNNAVAKERRRERHMHPDPLTSDPRLLPLLLVPSRALE
jgi:hypothetical protein